mmetsp:Transcript_10427/g.19147  ORF Transcript_10427/g.19147 Transcript_10427/m.19147 type:complete len:580 (+) Transcript_10427:74-1813(+)
MGEEEEVSAEEFAYSLMLTASITFQMTIFYLVNWPDDDIRAYAWSIIGNTILIFSGVLTFGAFNDVVDEFLVETYPDYKGLIKFGHFVFWVSVMQLVIARCSGWGFKKRVADTTENVVVAPQPPAPLACNSDEPSHLSSKRIVCCRRKKLAASTDLVMDEPVNSLTNFESNSEAREASEMKEADPETKHREMNNECFASLLGHIAGFAAIDFFGFLQQKTKLSESVIGAGSASILALFGLLVIFRFWTFARRKLIKPVKEVAEMWQEVAVDKENDVAGLAASALAFLAVRMALVGHLPASVGKLVATPEAALREMWQVGLIGVFWLALVIFLLWVHFASGLIDYEKEDAITTRISNMMQNFCNMCVSWATLLNVQLFLLWVDCFETGSINSAVAVAFMISYAAFIFIWVLDKVDDWMKDRNIQADWMNNIITAMGLAVGFAWEQSFDTATDDLSVRLMNVLGIPKGDISLINLGFSLLLCAIVLPAFRFYILPSVAEADDVKKEKDARIKEKFRGQEYRSLIREATRAIDGQVGQVTNAIGGELGEVTNAIGGELGQVKRVTKRMGASVSQPFLSNGGR